MASSKPAKLWMGTIPFTPEYDLESKLESPIIAYSKGQQELGESGYHHWQLFINLHKPQRLTAIKKIFGSGSHWEPTRSEAAEQYVWKESTRVAGTQFEHGVKPIQRNNVTYLITIY